MKSSKIQKRKPDATDLLDIIIDTAKETASSFAKDQIKEREIRREKQIDGLIEQGQVGLALQLIFGEDYP